MLFYGYVKMLSMTQSLLLSTRVCGIITQLIILVTLEAKKRYKQLNRGAYINCKPRRQLNRALNTVVKPLTMHFARFKHKRRAFAIRSILRVCSCKE